MDRLIYTMHQWESDKTFSAQPGQEVTEEVYEEMLTVAPPLRLPKSFAWKATSRLKVLVTSGFLMGEPVRSNAEGFLYHAFGINETGNYFYLGESPSDDQPKLERDLQENIEMFKTVFSGKRIPKLSAYEMLLLAKQAQDEENPENALYSAIINTWQAAFLEGYRYAHKVPNSAQKGK